MPIWAVTSSSSGSPVKDRENPEGSARSWLFRRDGLAFFVYGFAKSGRQNLRRDELMAFRALADEMLALDESALSALDAALANGTIIEVIRNG